MHTAAQKAVTDADTDTNTDPDTRAKLADTVRHQSVAVACDTLQMFRMVSVDDGKYFECRAGRACPRGYPNAPNPDDDPKAERLCICNVAGCPNVAHKGACFAACGFRTTADDFRFCSKHPTFLTDDAVFLDDCNRAYKALYASLNSRQACPSDASTAVLKRLAAQATTCGTIDRLVGQTDGPLAINADDFAYVMRHYRYLSHYYPLLDDAVRRMTYPDDSKYRRCQAVDCAVAEGTSVAHCVVAGCRMTAHLACLDACGLVCVQGIDEYVCDGHSVHIRSNQRFLRRCKGAYDDLGVGERKTAALATLRWLADYRIVHD